MTDPKPRIIDMTQMTDSERRRHDVMELIRMKAWITQKTIDASDAVDKALAADPILGPVIGAAIIKAYGLETMETRVSIALIENDETRRGHA